MSNRWSELKSLSGEQLLVRAGEVLPPWVAVLLVLAIAWQLVNLTWLLFPQGTADTALPATTAVATPGNATRPATRVYDINRIAAANIFGETPAEAPAVPDVNPDELDETRLNLTLRATIASTDDTVALAIIANDRGEEKVYAIGDAIAGGSKLHSVLPDRAILNNNGKLEALPLPKEFKSGSGTTTRSSTRRSSSSQARVARELQATLAQNPAKLTDLIRPQPVFSNGKQLGYRVYPGRRRQQFVSLGLKPGDLVTEINGTPLTDPAKGADIFRSLADANQVTVTVERNGTPEVLVLDTEQLSLDSKGGQQR